MKRFLKSIVVSVLGWQVRRLQERNGFKTVGIVGSYGKTSTKMAIAEMLETEFQVQYQKGNYNDIVTVPLIFFDQKLPSLLNPFAWLKVFWKNEQMLKDVYPSDVVVVELGIDAPDQMELFGKYLKLDYALVTALGPEHMEQFKDVKHVAREELKVQNFTDTIIINKDLCADELLSSLSKPYKSYSLDYSRKLPLDQWRITIDDRPSIRIVEHILSRARMYSLSAAVVMGLKFDMPSEKIQKKLPKITAVPGRMNALKGKKDSIIIDDTYNASPEATILALETLYGYPTKQRIALLGNMNELGKFSQELHRQVGEACNPNKLDVVVTLGEHANEFLADSAEKKGCKVIRTSTPKSAAEKIEEILGSSSVILAKGSQNGVFAEEAVKQLLADPEDRRKLVRQSPAWQKKKQQSFPEV